MKHSPLLTTAQVRTVAAVSFTLGIHSSGTFLPTKCIGKMHKLKLKSKVTYRLGDPFYTYKLNLQSRYLNNSPKILG